MSNTDSMFLLEQDSLNEISRWEDGCNLILEEVMTSTPQDIEIKQTNGVDVTIFTSILQKAESPNRNGRIYSKKSIDEALNRKMVQEKLQHKKWYGENRHPEEETVKRQTRIVPERISHIITDYWWKGELLYGRVETANNTAGKDFQGLIRQGCEASFSMRGLGGDASSKRKGGLEYIDRNLFIMCYDSVDFPSHPEAYMQEVLKEETTGESIINPKAFSEDVKVILEEACVFKVGQEEIKDLMKSNVFQKSLTENDHSIINNYMLNIFR